MAATKAASAAASAPFIPRRTFDASADITRSYFLGHHHAALDRMRRALSNVGLIIECRDFRVPLSSRNPLLERTLALSPAQRSRIVVYTKRDLGPAAGSDIVDALTRFHQRQYQQDDVVFLGRRHDARPLLDAVKRAARRADALVGLRALVVGMPNAGKSTLLNRLRARGMGPGFAKAARTGSQPGVTRKMGTPVRVVPAATPAADDEGGPGSDEGVLVVDTPGVFVPHVSDPESMLKLALVGCVKDGLVPLVTVADYLLFHLNRHDPRLYARFCPPTNDVAVFLAAVARRTGKLLRGGRPNLDAAADWAVQEWRAGRLGQFVLDDVLAPGALDAAQAAAVDDVPALSMNQARKRDKEARKAKSEAKRQGQASS